MTPIAQIRLAIRLFLHLEDLVGLKHLDVQEVAILSNALALWIRIQQTRITPATQSLTEAEMQPASMGQRTYRLEDRVAAPTRLWVEEAGQPSRVLRHVPVFCPWGFGIESLAVRDTALAILSDYFGEPLSKTTFVRGQGRACQYYPALVAALRIGAAPGTVHTHEIITLLRLRSQALQAFWEQGDTQRSAPRR